jgi:hypothetical protein
MPMPRMLIVTDADWTFSGVIAVREACGLTRHDAVIEAYAIPASVLAKVGARRPSSTDT